MQENDIMKTIKSIKYCDEHVIRFDCDYFGDEIILTHTYNGDENRCISYQFLKCYKINIDHGLNYIKTLPYKDMILAKNPFYLQIFEINKEVHDQHYLKGDMVRVDLKTEMYSCRLLFPPLEVSILCEDIKILTDRVII